MNDPQKVSDELRKALDLEFDLKELTNQVGSSFEETKKQCRREYKLRINSDQLISIEQRNDDFNSSHHSNNNNYNDNEPRGQRQLDLVQQLDAAELVSLGGGTEQSQLNHILFNAADEDKNEASMGTRDVLNEIQEFVRRSNAHHAD